MKDIILQSILSFAVSLAMSIIVYRQMVDNFKSRFTRNVMYARGLRKVAIEFVSGRIDKCFISIHDLKVLEKRERISIDYIKGYDYNFETDQFIEKVYVISDIKFVSDITGRSTPILSSNNPQNLTSLEKYRKNMYLADFELKFRSRYGGFLQKENPRFESSDFNDFIFAMSAKGDPPELLAARIEAMKIKGKDCHIEKFRPFNRIHYAKVDNHYNFLCSSLAFYALKMNIFFHVDVCDYAAIERQYFNDADESAPIKKNEDSLKMNPTVQMLILRKSEKLKREGYSDHIVKKFITDCKARNRSVFISCEHDVQDMWQNFPETCKQIVVDGFSFFGSEGFVIADGKRKFKEMFFGRFPRDEKVWTGESRDELVVNKDSNRLAFRVEKHPNVLGTTITKSPTSPRKNQEGAVAPGFFPYRPIPTFGRV